MNAALSLTRRNLLLATPAVAVAQVRTANAGEAAGNVESVRGEAFAQGDGARRTLAPASAVFIGDLVVTNTASSLALRLGAATQLRLGAEAQLRIERFLLGAGGVLELARGAMLYSHDSEAGSPELTVRSRFGLIAVRGTRFFAGPSNGPFGVFVMQGVVTVVGRNTAVMVQAGHGTDLASPGAEPTMPHPWGAKRIEQAMASLG